MTSDDDVIDEHNARTACPVVAPVKDATSMRTPFVTASHELLFRTEEPSCDACGAAVSTDDSDGDSDVADGAGQTGGHGLYVWARSCGVVYEEPPLCASCARAITITALHRWEIEEEEG
jgi:hypothetical protein